VCNYFPTSHSGLFPRRTSSSSVDDQRSNDKLK
jgi:hypothetical protein